MRAAIALAFWAMAAAAGAQILPQGEALRQAVAARDAELFELVFLGCDPVRLSTMLTPDFEMYHDKDGVVATRAEPFVAQYAKDCQAQKAPDSWRSRRELVAGTLSVDPVPGYGAIEDGDHVFYERKGNGPERLAGRAHFTHLWRYGPDGWRLARVFSYSHRAANP